MKLDSRMNEGLSLSLSSFIVLSLLSNIIPISHLNFLTTRILKSKKINKNKERKWESASRLINYFKFSKKKKKQLDQQIIDFNNHFEKRNYKRIINHLITKLNEIINDQYIAKLITTLSNKRTINIVNYSGIIEKLNDRI